MIEFADRFERRLELLVVGERAAHPGNVRGPQAELTGARAWVAYREHRERMAFAAGTLGAAARVIADGAHQQRPAQNIGRNRQTCDELCPRRDKLLLFSSHSYE